MSYNEGCCVRCGYQMSGATCPCDEPDTRLEDHLRQMAEFKVAQGLTYDLKHNSLEEFVLAHGRAYDAPTHEEPLATQKECFRNAFMFVLGHRDAVYVEGYAAGIIPTMHAWAWHPDLGTVDNTWGTATQGRAFEGEPAQYYGVAFSRQYLMHAVHEAGYYGLIDAWYAQHPVLRLEPEEFLHTVQENPPAK